MGIIPNCFLTNFFIEIESHCVVLAALKLAVETRLALNHRDLPVSAS